MVITKILARKGCLDAGINYVLYGDKTEEYAQYLEAVRPLTSWSRCCCPNSDDVILLCCDSAAWHKSGGLNLPNNIVPFYIPPYTPEMNPIEPI